MIQGTSSQENLDGLEEGRDPLLNAPPAETVANPLDWEFKARLFLRAILPVTASDGVVDRGVKVLEETYVLALLAVAFCITAGMAIAFVYIVSEGDEHAWSNGWNAAYDGLLVAINFLISVVLFPLWAAVYLLGWALWVLLWILGAYVVVFVVSAFLAAYSMRYFTPSIFFTLSPSTRNHPLLRLFDDVFLPAVVHSIVFSINADILAPYTLYLIGFYAYLTLTSIFNLSLLRFLLRGLVWLFRVAMGWKTKVQVEEDEEMVGEEMEATRVWRERVEQLEEELRKERMRPEVVNVEAVVPPPYPQASAA